MSYSVRRQHLFSLIIVVLVHNCLVVVQTNSDHELNVTDAQSVDLQEAYNREPNQFETQNEQTNLTALEDLMVNNLLERFRPLSTRILDTQQLNETKHSPKRDLLDQSLSTAEMDALVYEEHQNETGRQFQYDTTHIDHSDLSENNNERLSRYTMSNESLAIEPQQRITSPGQDAQQRNSAARGRGLSKISHHSKPPYATGDQFSNHHVSSLSIPNELPLINTHKRTTNVIAELITAQNITETNDKHQQSNSTKSDTELANSIKRISTDLANDNHTETTGSGSKGLEQVENLLEKQEFQKLAPANSLVELMPLADDPVLGRQPPKEPPSEWSSDNPLHYIKFPDGSQITGHELSPVDFQHDPTLSDRFFGKPSTVDSLPNLAVDHSLVNNFLTRNTIEAVSNQLKQQQQSQANADLSQVWDTQGSNDNSDKNNKNKNNNHHIVHRAGPPTHYAASLTNVTAPLIPPHSATEAMETSLGDQAGREILSHVSGFLRQANNSLQHRTAQSKQKHPTSGEMNSQSIYLPPANSLTTQRPLPRPAHDLLSTLTSQVEPVISTTATPANISTDRRLDSFGIHGRRPSSSGQLVPSLPSHQASGFRSPVSVSGASQQTSSGGTSWHSPYLTSYLNMPLAVASNQDGAPLAASPSTISNALAMPSGVPPNSTGSTSSTPAQVSSASFPGSTTASLPTSTTNGFITNGPSMSSEPSPMHQHYQVSSTTPSSSATSLPPTFNSTFATTAVATGSNTALDTSSGSNGVSQPPANGLNRRVFNLTRVEHISAECSNDLIRTIIVFNGTFRGMIYSSGYVRDSSCIYVNGTGKTRYDFSIRLNQCGTLTRQELHPAGKDNDVRRRDQVMWNTLSIQYNPIIEQEWDEHFRVSCEYGSDFWKTVSFNPFNVETNTGSPVVFTVDPPQCQMEILRGHGMVGPRQETISGPVTVGDPLTLLIHMKSERAGYDILVKNCIAHDNVKQRMQLIDSNGCVVNERFISPFRGTYNDNDLKHVTLYAYLKAFRFTGSPILYLECEIHMCQSSCPPQMCYWRRLSKRSALSSNGTQTLQHHSGDSLMDDDNPGHNVRVANSTSQSRQGLRRTRKGRKMGDQDEKPTSLSDKMSLTQSLLVRPLDDPDAAAYSEQQQQSSPDQQEKSSTSGQLLCYKRAEVLGSLLATGSLLLVAMSVTIACCWQQTNKLKRFTRSNMAEAANRNRCGPSSSMSSLSSANSNSPSLASTTYLSNLNHSLVGPGQMQSIRRPSSIQQPSMGRHKERLLILSLLQAHVI